jgi:predicted ATPase/DNA-binding CsgD family transcriptional regulator
MEPTPRPPGRPPHNLPSELSSFVGRGKELAELRRLLENKRLLTLTGSGGCGKTRLALAVAGELVEGFEDGVWMVELAALSDPDLVPQAVASVLGVSEQPGRPLGETLCESLGSKVVLLVLDNCEHLIGACAELAETLLRSCQNLRVLATSREALGVTGESSRPVPPLSLPDPHRLPTAEGLPSYEAARLFVERARTLKPDFEPNAHNAKAIAQVCYRLDGIPLAIELAAARVRLLSVEQISTRLDDRFGLLTGGGRTTLPRQRTLRAAMDWGHELLEESERILFRRLSIFAGDFPLDAAEAMCSGEGIERDEVPELLFHLVDKSLLVMREQGGEARYRLLETLRQYGWEKLGEAGEREELSRRHAAFFLELAEEAEPALLGAGQAAWLGRLEAEHDNLRAALSWSLGGGDAQLGLRLGAALGEFWHMRGHLIEGRRWLERGLADGDDLPSDVRAKALNEAGWIGVHQGYDQATALLEESLALYRELSDESGVATSLAYLGLALVHHQGDRRRLEELRREAEALRRERLNKRVAARLLHFLALATLVGGDYSRSAALAEEGLAHFRELEDARDVVVMLIILGMLALPQGLTGRAVEVFEEGLRVSHELGDKVSGAFCLLGLAGADALEARPARAAHLWGALEALQEDAGIAVASLPLVRSWYDYDGRVAAARSRLDDEATWEAAWAEGRSMGFEEAIEYVLHPSATPEESPSHPSGLSAREVEVLRLVAQGMTNARIAKELFLSPRTVNGHMGSVYRKLGFSSRAEATRFASEHDLLR